MIPKHCDPASQSLSVSEIERNSLDYVDNSSRFHQVSRDFSKQYAHIYSARLNTFRNILEKSVYEKWGSKHQILKLCELRENTTCVVIGTLFKQQILKPSILKELSDQLEIVPLPPMTHFVDESDSLVLEDELQRIKLVGDCIDVHQLVTGVVCALLGSEEEDGVFKVKDVCWPECNVQKPLPTLPNDQYLVLISGLNLSSKKADHWLSLHLMIEWLTGMMGTDDYQRELSKVVRVIIAGGAFAADTGGYLREADVVESVGSVDAVCAALSAAAPLDLMPGCKDPNDVMLPQKPLHYCLFPKAVENKSFNRVPNPYECEIGGVGCLGTSGEPVKDVLRYSEVESEVAAMRATLRWRHLAPTCPDTVPSTPCLDTDPFAIYTCPAVYFAGNCSQFATELYQGPAGQKVRIVCVPNFFASDSIAIVNLKTLDCHSMTFA